MKILVIGAGIAGLGAAWYFSRRGHEVTVFEASARPGGRAITLRRPGSEDIVDAGTQYYHTNYRRALRLIEETGLDSRLERISGHTRIYNPRARAGSFLLHRRMPWYRTAGIAGNLQLGWFLLNGLLRYKVDTFGLNHRAVGDDIPVGVTAPVIDSSIVRPLAQVGALAEPAAMDLGMNQLMRLINIILFTDYLSLSSGTASLHEALASRLRVRYETPVRAIIEQSGRVAGIELEGSGELIAADHVVVATVPPVAATMLPVEWKEEIEFLSAIRIPPFTLPVFFLDRPLQPQVWSYLLHELPGHRIRFLTDAAAKNPAMVPSGKAVIQPWICYPESAALVGMSDSDIIDLCCAELEQVFPGFSGWVEHIELVRHSFGVPFHPVGHARRASQFLERVDRRRISFCGDYFSGGYMESALWSAERAAIVHG